ncbi:MAG: type II secretion system protein GspM [Deltaproteobacteria bacterium]|nr:type II secretion system protein GspM [Deltaproteobacteria bacterium]
MRLIWQRLSKREKAFVASAFFILLLVLGRYLLVFPLLEYREWVQSQLEIKPQLYEKKLRYVGRRREIEGALDRTRRELKALEPRLLSGGTPSVSASSLQEMIQTIARKEGTQVIRTKVLSPEIKGAYMRIPIQIEVSGQIDQVVNLLRGIGSAERLLVVDELNIRSLLRPASAARRRASRRRQTASQVPAGNLRASLTISGFTRSQPTTVQKNEAVPAQAESEEEEP